MYVIYAAVLAIFIIIYFCCANTFFKSVERYESQLRDIDQYKEGGEIGFGGLGGEGQMAGSGSIVTGNVLGSIQKGVPVEPSQIEMQELNN